MSAKEKTLAINRRWLLIADSRKTSVRFFVLLAMPFSATSDPSLLAKSRCFGRVEPIEKEIHAGAADARAAGFLDVVRPLEANCSVFGLLVTARTRNQPLSSKWIGGSRPLRFLNSARRTSASTVPFLMICRYSTGTLVARLRPISSVSEPPGVDRKDVAGRSAFDHRSQQRAVGDEHAARFEAFPPGFLREFVAAEDVHAVGADGVVVESGAAAGGGRNAEAAVENVVVHRFRPAAVAARTGEERFVARAAVFSLSTTPLRSAWWLDQLDGVELAAGEPDGEVPGVREWERCRFRISDFGLVGACGI